MLRRALTILLIATGGFPAGMAGEASAPLSAVEFVAYDWPSRRLVVAVDGVHIAHRGVPDVVQRAFVRSTAKSPHYRANILGVYPVEASAPAAPGPVVAAPVDPAPVAPAPEDPAPTPARAAPVAPAAVPKASPQPPPAPDAPLPVVLENYDWAARRLDVRVNGTPVSHYGVPGVVHGAFAKSADPWGHYRANIEDIYPTTPAPRWGGRNLVPLPSKVFSGAWYDAARGEMVIVFKNGTALEYEGVPEEVFSEFVRTPSRNEFYLRSIEGRYASFSAMKLAGRAADPLPEHAKGSITGRVWEDVDGDGRQGVNEPPLPGVSLVLEDGEGGAVAETRSGLSGAYVFHGLEAGRHTVRPVVPAGWRLTHPPGGSDPLGSAVQPETGRTADIHLTLSERRVQPARNAGLFRPARVSGQVREDTLGTGDLSASHPPVAGAALRLYPDRDGSGIASGPEIATAVTDAEGRYAFADLPPGGYLVEQEDLPGHTSTADSNPPNDGRVLVALVSGSDATGADFLDCRLCGVGGKVWEDMDGNRLPDPGEPGVPNLAVRLFDGEGIRVAETASGATGDFAINGLRAGAYALHFDLDSLPEGVVPFLPAQAGETPEGLTLAVRPVDATSGVFQGGLLLGVYRPVVLAGQVWLDADGNGIQADGEPPVEGVRASVREADGEAVAASLQSDAQGAWRVERLFPGNYLVAFDPASFPPGTAPSPRPAAASGVAVVSAVDPATLSIGPTGPLVSGEKRETLHLGLMPVVSLSGTVWEDANANGLADEDPEMHGVPGVAVELLRRVGEGFAPVATALSGSDPALPPGAFRFEGVGPGEYEIRPVPQSIPTHFSFFSTAPSRPVVLPGAIHPVDLVFGLIADPEASPPEFVEDAIIVDPAKPDEAPTPGEEMADDPGLPLTGGGVYSLFLPGDSSRAQIEVDGVPVPALELGDFLLFYADADARAARVTADAQPLRMEEVDAFPGDEGGFVSVGLPAEGQLWFTALEGETRYLVFGFGGEDGLVLDITRPDAPRRLVNTPLVSIPGDSAIYIGVDGGETLLLHAVRASAIRPLEP